VVRLDLAGMPEVLTVLSGRESTVRKLDALRERYGDAPAAWYPALTGELWPDDGVEGDDPLWTEAAE
jgi:type IV secretion system protein VirB4